MHNILQMSLALLPKELQTVISQFNVEHRPIMRTVLSELLVKCKQRVKNSKWCVNCCDYANEQYSTYIFWRKYRFCSEWCRYDTESGMRKHYRNVVKKRGQRR